MSYICDKCKEELYFRDEVMFLMGNNEVFLEEEGGSGDYDRIICGVCCEEEE
ncbi:MAG: hypothetical protein ACRCVJ_18485 [Clostridium sp.]|uniref:hypothetical protein n=1 Tax=Clostridium sp. TaxID=1506 RepID=UPI003F3F9527